jgi:hypothetical protein
MRRPLTLAPCDPAQGMLSLQGEGIVLVGGLLSEGVNFGMMGR